MNWNGVWGRILAGIFNSSRWAMESRRRALGNGSPSEVYWWDG